MIALSLEQRMLLHSHRHQEIASRHARRAGFAFAGVANLDAVVHTGRDRHFDIAPNADATVAAAGRAWIGHDLPAPTARPARLLNAEEALLHHHRAATAASLTGRQLCAFAGAGAAALGAILLARNRNGLLRALIRFGEVD